LIQDEGIGRTLLILWNTVKNPAAFKQVWKLWRIFRQYETNLGAVMLVAEKGQLLS